MQVPPTCLPKGHRVRGTATGQRKKAIFYFLRRQKSIDQATTIHYTMKFSAAIFIACSLFSVALAEDTEPSVTLVLDNKSGMTCEIYWRYEGGEKLLKTLAADEKYAEHTWPDQKVIQFSNDVHTVFLTSHPLVHCQVRWKGWGRTHDRR
jgi:hypothetical protein